jgi:tripeptidyl-peptidase-1
MRIALAQRNLHVLEKRLMEISHPESPKFSQHMTSAQVVDLFRPRQETVSAVMKWLQNFGIKTNHIRIRRSKGWLSFKLTVAEAERLLKTKYYVYEHINGKRYSGTEEYSVPAMIQRHIDFITPTLNFDVQTIRNQPKSNGFKNSPSKDVQSVGAGLASNAISANVQDLSSCNQQITPLCLQTLYNFANYQQKSSAQNNYGIVEFTPQSFIQTDLDLFLSQFNPNATGTAPIIDFIDGAVLDTTDPTESNLDLQYAIDLVYPTPVTLYQTGDIVEGDASFDTFLDAIDSFFCTFEGGDDPIFDPLYPDPSNASGSFQQPEDCGTFNATNVISVSYSGDEASYTPAYIRRQCFEYGKLGLQGVTVLYSSGDYGVAGYEGQCIDPQTKQITNGTTAIQFNPTFPGTCPYITSVGATQINPNSTVNDPESAASLSSGGFSNVFQLPCYQKNAVNNYFALHKPDYSSTQFNNSGNTRGFPDISANGVNYAIIINGQFTFVDGTSASSPVVGSIVTLINDARLAVGKRPVGFLNPVLYVNPQALNDIISGNNPGCETEGFSAVNGWDPVTGLGTPNFQKLVDVYLSLP